MANETQQTSSAGAVEMMTQAQIQEPKSTVGLFTLPCGFLDATGTLHSDVVVREITGREEDMLTGDKIPDKKKISELLTRCITRLGSLTDKSAIVAAVPELLVGDRVFLMIAIRRTALGDNYPFKDKCPDCEKESLMSINLGALEISPMPEPLKRSFDARLPSRAALLAWSDEGEVPAAEKLAPTGHTLRFRPANGRDEEKFSKVKNEDEALSESLKTRVELLDGKPPTVEALQTLTFSERAYIRDLFEEADGGVETTIEVSCPKCDFEYTRELDLGQMGFFFPSAARKNLKTRSST